MGWHGYELEKMNGTDPLFPLEKMMLMRHIKNVSSNMKLLMLRGLIWECAQNVHPYSVKVKRIQALGAEGNDTDLARVAT